MEGIIQKVSEALNLDSEGLRQEASVKYFDCLEGILELMKSMDTTSDNNRDQLVLMAANCTSRLRDLHQTQPSTAASIGVDLASLRRLHETQLVTSRYHSRSPSLTLPANTGKLQSKNRLKALLQAREDRKHTIVWDWIQTAFARIEHSQLMLFKSFYSPPEQLILEAMSRRDDDDLAEAVFLYLVSTNDHPVIGIASDFIKQLYHHLLDPTRTLKQTCDEIIWFAEYFTKWFVGYWKCDLEPFQDGLWYGVLLFIFSTDIYRLLMDRYYQDWKPTWRPDICFEGLIAVLEIDTADNPYQYYTKFPIAQDDDRLREAITLVSAVPSTRTLAKKINSLVKACSSICRSNLPTTTEKMGGEDLMRWMALVILRSPVSHLLPGEVMMLSDFVPERVLRGEAGYVIATMQGAIEYLGML